MRILAGPALALALASGEAARAQNIEPVGEPIEEALETGVLLPGEVLRSSALTFPSILASFEREAAARADQLAADGAFDLMLQGEAYDRVTGTFSGGFVEAEARQPLAPMGAELYSSYHLSDGRFPIYENIYNTNEFGELKIGGLLSLLRDRRIDDRRFEVEDARLATGQARLDILLVQLQVQHEALRAYWRWVAAGYEIRVYEELLEIAEARAVGLERQVRLGAAPRIALTENEQNVLRRRILLTEAQRDFAMAARSLSYYLRGGDGEVIVPSRDQLPEDLLDNIPDLAAIIAQQTNFLLEQRPELATLRIALERARNTIALRENDLQPRLDAFAELSRDFGPIGDGGPTFDSTDTVVGVTFAVPLQRREARGRLRRAEAELRELELREQRIADEIGVEIDNILTRLAAALRLADLAEGEVEQAVTMVEAERRRFRLGAGDFFLVNVREEAAADAQIREIRANLNGRLAQASYNAATMDLEALGLE
ncbi:TolC family protein [Erythrobacter sp.]|jgi:outer membrane protein TolC|uniref:TolC family protein n=1 Tax=Erythrobacter sp. TaxID=1042 RepID=UPI002ED1F470